MVHKNSDSNKVVTRKKKEVEVSCWNCFTVESSDKDTEPVPLSTVRKVNRDKFKLYSVLASEISRPKAVPFKQKVSENYSIGKKLEEKLTKDTKKTDDTKLSVPEPEECTHTDDEQHLSFEKSKIEIISDSDNGSSETLHKKLLPESSEKDEKSEDTSDSSYTKSNISKIEASYNNNEKSPFIKSSSFGDSKNGTILKREHKKVPTEEIFKKVKTDVISKEKKENPIVQRKILSFTTFKTKTITESKNKYSVDKPNTTSVNSEIDIMSNARKNIPVIKVNTPSFEISEPEITFDVRKENPNTENILLSGKSNISVLDQKKTNLDEKKNIILLETSETNIIPDIVSTKKLKTFNTDVNETLTKEETKDPVAETESLTTDISEITIRESAARNLSHQTAFSDKEEKSIGKDTLTFESTKNKIIPNLKTIIPNNLQTESSVNEGNYSRNITMSIGNKEFPIDQIEKSDIETTQIDSKKTPSIEESKIPLNISLLDHKDVTSVLNKEKQLSSKTDKGNPDSIITTSEIVTIPSNREVYPIVEEQYSPLESSEFRTFSKDEYEKSNSSFKTTLLINDDDKTAADKTKSSESFKIDTVSISKKNSPVIVHKVQIETSTPKPLKCEVEQDNLSKLNSPSLVRLINKDDDVEKIIEGIQNISLDNKAETVLNNDKTDNSSFNGSESGYGGSSMRDLNDIDMPKSISTKRESLPEFSDYSEPSTPTPTKKDALKCLRGHYKSSLPVLTANYKRNILKSSKSLSGDSSDDLSKPVKSLRWNTLGLPRKSKDDDVYTGPTSPGHATLPRRSNSPLPHERDLLDRDRFSLNRSGLQARSESMASVYSGAGEGMRGTVTVRGDVQISLLYNYRLGALEVGVKRCRDLAPVDTKRNRSDPYVKVYLLPDKSKAGKRKSKVKKNTLNPVFEETLSFVQPLASLSSRTLWLSVWHADMFGRNDFLGEVTLPLADVVFDDPAPMWYKLHERTEQFECEMGSRGELIVGLKLEVDMGRGATLHVLVKEAKNLQPTKPNGLADVFCKSYLLPERGRLAKQKTTVAKRTLNPSWEHTFTYRGLKLQELNNRALELSLWDRDRLASNDFMGAVRLSLGTGTYMGASVNWMDSVGKEMTLWQRMMEHPNLWVEGSLPLRPQLNN